MNKRRQHAPPPPASEVGAENDLASVQIVGLPSTALYVIALVTCGGCEFATLHPQARARNHGLAEQVD